MRAIKITFAALLLAALAAAPAASATAEREHLLSGDHVVSESTEREHLL